MANSVFAYGSNTNRADFFERTGIDLSSYPSEIAILFGYKLAFTRFAKSRNGGVLDIVPDELAVVPGVLYHGIPDEVLDRMDRKEGVNKEDVRKGAYKRQIVSVWNTKSLHFEQAHTYQVVNPTHHVDPSDSYVDIVKAGMNDFGLPSSILDAIRKDEQYPMHAILRWFLNGMNQGDSFSQGFTRELGWGGEGFTVNPEPNKNTTKSEFYPEVTHIQRPANEVSRIVDFIYFIKRFMRNNKRFHPLEYRVVVGHIGDWLNDAQGKDMDKLSSVIANNTVALIEKIAQKAM